MQEGEKSTKYFLNLLKARTNRIQIKKLKITPDRTSENVKEIDSEITNFYRSLYENKNEPNEQAINTFIQELKPLDQLLINKAEMEITKKELRETLKSCSDSAPGPDGITYSFYKYTWPISGGLIVNSWNEALKNLELGNESRISTLTLLPKDGKDLNEIKNWRPITLSNCDLKLITKTLMGRLTEVLESTIDQHQTAYIKGRSISDNLRLIDWGVRTATKNNRPLMIVALDAMKAFDSVNHYTIEKALNWLGLKKLAEIFKILYENQVVDIVLKNSQIGRYKINQGVKQGDSLSCILFILIIEMLLKKINRAGLNQHEWKKFKWPTAVGYADDVTLMLTNERDLQTVIDIYAEFYKATGLKINADKTEMIKINIDQEPIEIKYLNKQYEITPQPEIKINGVWIGSDEPECYKLNWKHIIKKMKIQINMWFPRNLTILGKIQIIKTFAYSQALYLARVTPPTQETLKEINTIINQFVWNRNANMRGPHRIKARIMNKPINQGGFGLTRLEDIIHKMNHRQIIVNSTQKSLIHELNLRMTNVTSINPKISNEMDGIVKNFCKMTRLIWHNYATEKTEFTKNDFDSINDSNINDILEEDQRAGLWNYINKYHNKKVREIDIREILSKIKPPWKRLITNTSELVWLEKNQNPPRITVPEVYLKGKKEKKVNLDRLPSNYDPELATKCGILLMANEHKSLMHKIKKLPGVWNRDVILRYMHGDVRYRTKLVKTGYLETNQCDYCGLPETQEHKYIDCDSNTPLNRLLESIIPQYNSINKWLEYDKITTKQLEDLSYFIVNVEKFKSNKVDPFDYYDQRLLRNKKHKSGEKAFIQKLADETRSNPEK